MTSCRRFLRESFTCFRFRKGAEEQLLPIYRVRVTVREGRLLEDVMHVTRPRPTGDGVESELRLPV